MGGVAGSESKPRELLACRALAAVPVLAAIAAPAPVAALSRKCRLETPRPDRREPRCIVNAGYSAWGRARST